MKKVLLLLCAFLLPVLLGLSVIVFFALTAKEEVGLAVFINIWLFVVPAVVGFVTGRLYPEHPYKISSMLGALLAFLLIVPLVVFVPLLRVWWLQLSLLMASCLIACLSALFSVVSAKAKLLWQKERDDTAETSVLAEDS